MFNTKYFYTVYVQNYKISGWKTELTLEVNEKIFENMD